MPHVNGIYLNSNERENNFALKIDCFFAHFRLIRWKTTDAWAASNVEYPIRFFTLTHTHKPPHCKWNLNDFPYCCWAQTACMDRAIYKHFAFPNIFTAWYVAVDHVTYVDVSYHLKMFVGGARFFFSFSNHVQTETREEEKKNFTFSNTKRWLYYLECSHLFYLLCGPRNR